MPNHQYCKGEGNDYVWKANNRGVSVRGKSGVQNMFQKIFAFK